MNADYDAIIVGAGPAGSTAAILLAQAGWSVALIEKQTFPRRKVCGECIAATNLPLLDALGVGAAFDALAGPELRRVGLFVGAHALAAELPPFAASEHAWGRALGREHLDTLLLQRAAALGANIWQPWTVKRMTRDGTRHVCHALDVESGATATLSAPLLITAHGSWEPDPSAEQRSRRPQRSSDLFAFKATFRNAHIEPGLLPVLAFTGGYGGMVLGDHGLTTLAFCIRRDTLRECRTRNPALKAALAAHAHVVESCLGVRRTLANAELEALWLSVGPIQPGIRAPWRDDGTFAIGNVAGEAHPILGEGISMAIQSAWLLCERLLARGDELCGDEPTARAIVEVGRDYAASWRRSFAPRIRLAAVFAHLAMRPDASSIVLPLLHRWPGILTAGARLGAKVRQVVEPPATAGRCH
ncbi:MAG TPA: NAD(P)/FAD-dependent oxidoreductase [Luteimonas sp.]|nr:NAD(P)/FAD-dependent oxidoreductase [Luteimonas sp.]